MKRFLASTFDQFRLLNRPARLFLQAIFFDGLLFSGFNLFFNLYIIEAGFDRDFLGLVNAAPSISALLLGVPMGLLSDRIGRKRAMLAGFTIANFAIIGTLLTRSEAAIIVLAFIWGAAGQLYFLSHAPFMMKASDDKSRDILFSFSFGMFPLSSTLGSFLAGYLPGLFREFSGVASSAGAYQAALLVCVTASFVALIPLALIRDVESAPAQEKAGGTADRPPLRKALFRPLTLKLSLPNLAIGLGAAILVPYFNIFFVERYGMSDSALGILFGAGSLITGIGCIIGPRLVGGLGGKIRTVVIGQAISLFFLLAIGFSPWPWLAMAGFLVRGALMNMVAPFFDAYALERTDEAEHGTVNSIRNLAWNVGWAVGPYISGVVQQHYGFSPLFVGTAVLYAIAIALTWFFFRPKAGCNPPPVPVLDVVT
ncbi:MAG: MFS transporter [Chloroflexi bacterium]|nr:MFS transporter [Chloroflexota bacterium]